MTIFNPDIKVPNRVAWKTDDKAWMKQRREHWKHVKDSLNQIIELEKRNIKYLKQYYMTGEEDERFTLTSYEFMEGLLYELWFHPDQSIENWEQLRERHRDWAEYEKAKQFHPNLKGDDIEAYGVSSRDARIVEATRLFKNYSDYPHLELYDHFPKTGVSFFCGLEEQMFHFLCPEMQSFSRDRYKSNISDEEFLEEAYGRYQGNALNFLLYLETPKEKVNPFIITRWRVQEFHDAILIGYRERPELEWLVTQMAAVLADPSSYHETQVQLAKEVQEVLNDPKLPQAAKDKIDEVRVKTAE